MCKKPQLKNEAPPSTLSEYSSSDDEQELETKGSTRLAPTHSANKRNTKYDLLLFVGPAVLTLFGRVTPILPMYLIAITRIVVVHIILSLHYQFVDKDNYQNKLTQQQLEREGSEYYFSFLMHMWIQVPLQLIFPGLFFSDSSEIFKCCFEVFLAHVFIVEPSYYFFHRWLHIPKWMKAMHGFHHLSINTLPTTATTQNFYEHILYVVVLGQAFLLPFLLQGRQHWVAVGAYLVGFDIVNIYGHTNIRIQHWIFNHRWSPLKYLFYTPEFHLGHHNLFNCNYGLFMPIWDYLFGTVREYKKPLPQLLPQDQQDFVFIGHNGGLGHLFTIPELCIYNVYTDFIQTWLPLKVEVLIMHAIGAVTRLFAKFYYCSRYCIANEYIGRIICLARTPYDYINPKKYDSVNRDMIDLIKQEHQKFGTRYYGLGNLNKMKQLNDGGIEFAKMVKEDAYLKDKNIRIWTGDTMTVASVYHQIADIPGINSFYYIGAGGKVGTAVCNMLVKTNPQMKIRIFSLNHVLDHPNISYSTDLSEMCDYKVVLVGKILSSKMYQKAFRNANTKATCKTRFMLDYTVPAMPVKRPDFVQQIRIGLLKTSQGNAFLKGHYDYCMSHPQNHIVPCHFGCILNTINGRETDEVGEIDLNDVDKLWKMTRARGFSNTDIDYSALQEQ